MSFKLKTLAALVAAGLCGLAVNASAFTPSDLGLSTPQDFQIKYNNYEFLLADSSVGSGFSNTSSLYLGDNFGIFNVTSIQDSQGLNNLWNSGQAGNTIPRVTGVFWGFDVYDANPFGAKASGGHIAIFANPTFDLAIREQGPGMMIGTPSTVVDGVSVPTYLGITTGQLLMVADYQNGCSAGDPLATLCAPTFFPVGGSFLGAAKGFAEVNPAAGDLGFYFDTGSLTTDIPGVKRDLSIQSNFTPPSQSGLPAGQTTKWPVWSFDPVFGRTVPEPTTLALLGAGFAAFGLGRRNKKA